jgi:hypothetical protein
VTGEYFVATVAGEYGTLFADSSKGDPSACPFLRRDSEGGHSICAIYPTRPSFCRAFRCSHADILDFKGIKIGKVGGKRSLLSRDPALIALWEQQVVPLRETDDLRWKEQVKFLLEREGYRVILYE